MEKVKLFVFSSMRYFIIIWSSYYLLPLLAQSKSAMISMFLIFIPLIVVIVSFIYGLKIKHFYLFFSVIVGISFIPAVYIFMNSSALVYVLIYTALSILCSTLGRFIEWFKKS